MLIFSPRSLDKVSVNNKGPPFGVTLRSANNSDTELKGKDNERRYYLPYLAIIT